MNGVSALEGLLTLCLMLHILTNRTATLLRSIGPEWTIGSCLGLRQESVKINGQQNSSLRISQTKWQKFLDRLSMIDTEFRMRGLSLAGYD